MVQPRRAKVLPQAVGERRVVAEDDPVEDRAPLSRQPGRDRTLESSADAISEPAETTAPADLTPRVQPEHDVDAVPAQPRALVEPVRRAARRSHECERIQDRALRRRAAERKLELHRLVDRPPREAADASLCPHGELSFPRRRGDDDDGVSCAADIGGERTDVERVEPGARPPPSDRDEEESGAGKPHRGHIGDDECRCREHRPAQGNEMNPADVRKREPEAE